MRALLFAAFSAIYFATAKPDFYAILGIDRDVSEQAVKQAYRQLSLKWHPDRHHAEESQEKAQDMFIDISEAYATLSDKVKRNAYDLSCAAGGDRCDGSVHPDLQEAAAEFYSTRTFQSRPSPHGSHAYFARESKSTKQAYPGPGHSVGGGTAFPRESKSTKQDYPGPGHSGGGGTVFPRESKSTKQAYPGPGHSGQGGAATSAGFNGRFVHEAETHAPRFGGQRGGAHQGHSAPESHFGHDWFGDEQDDSGEGTSGIAGADGHFGARFSRTSGMRARDIGRYNDDSAHLDHAAETTDWFSVNERDGPRLSQHRQATPPRFQQTEIADPNLFYGDVPGITELSVIGIGAGWQEMVEDNKENRSIFVIFYAPSSGRCKSLKPIFADFAQNFTASGMIQMGAVDCDGHRARCRKEMGHDIEDLPAVIHYGPNNASAFVKVDQSMGLTGLSHWFQGVFSKVPSRI